MLRSKFTRPRRAPARAVAAGRTRRSGRPCAAARRAGRTSTIAPFSITRMRSACMMVESRCAITSVVRPLQSSAIASCTWRSDSESSAGGRLVEQDDRRILDQRARDLDALALPAGELQAVLADRRVVALRERHDEVVRMRGLRGGDDLGLGRVRACRSGCCRAPSRGTGARSARHRRSAGAATGARRCAMFCPSMVIAPPPAS